MVNVPNFLVFLPIWYLFLPSGMSEASTGEIAFQAAFQGLGPGILALALFTMSSVHLGPTATAGVSAAVPTGAAVLAIPVLGEALSAFEWAGVAVATAGLALLVWRNAR